MSAQGKPKRVAAELISIKDRTNPLKTLTYSAIGESVGGIAGAVVGAGLVPEKVDYIWRVLYSDGSYKTFKFTGDDPRNEILSELPYLPDYLAWQEGLGENPNLKDKLYDNLLDEDEDEDEDEDACAAAQPASKKASKPQAKLKCDKEEEESSSSQKTKPKSVVIGAGDYVFGENFPYGTFDFQAVSGSGFFTVIKPDDDESFTMLGVDCGAESYHGLSSDMYKSFNISSDLRLRVTRSKMIEI